MTKNADEIVVGANGSIYVGAVGAAVPASIDEALGVDWTETGYVTEDGVAFSDGKTVESIRAWQSLYDLRRIVTAKDASAKFSLLQWNADTFALAFGGGEVTSPAAGAYRYVPPPAEEIDERALAIEWQDGTKDYRLILPKGMVSDTVETTLTRSAAGLLPIAFSILGQDEVDPWIFDTNDPAFAGAGS